MECRLCLGSAPAESSVSIFGDPHPERLEQRIRTCCQIYVKRGDGLPNTVCLSCKTNLESLISFRKACFRNNETSQVRLDDCLNNKTEEVLLEDLIWDDEPSIPTIHRKSSEICSNPSPSESELVLHTREKLFKCATCLKSFTRKDRLVMHLRSHTGEKPYKCEMCSKSFSEKSSLKSHVILHTEIRPHKCEICLKSFFYKYRLESHKISHTGVKPYKCEICLKSFTLKSSFGLHKKSHTGIKPHKCDICLKSFTQKSSLLSHEKLHSGIKPYICEICLKSFSKKLPSFHMKNYILGYNHTNVTFV
ncbi:uncharacterized protein LOC143919138 [Arctopsyche grandis]|uniref:uncharacterized protein LOC143919138 n=1 Tax=Arctopsyche grandis TaxID=121162 RepID=UPI00406D9501